MYAWTRRTKSLKTRAKSDILIGRQTDTLYQKDTSQWRIQGFFKETIKVGSERGGGVALLFFGFQRVNGSLSKYVMSTLF
jgi:hypothetical protein